MKILFVTLSLLVFTTIFGQTLDDTRGVWLYSPGPTKVGDPNGNECGREVYNKNKLFFSEYGSGTTEGIQSIYDYYQLRGALLIFSWKKLEPSKGNFNWDLLKNELKDAANSNLKAYGVMIWTGQYAPSWIYDAPDNITKVVTKESSICEIYYPDYLGKEANFNINLPNPYSNPANKYNNYADDGISLVEEDLLPDDNLLETKYEILWHNMLNNVLSYIANMTPANTGFSDQTILNIKNKFLFLQTAEGTTGDLRPYKFIPKDEYRKFQINEEEWSLFLKKNWAFSARKIWELRNSLPNLKLMINGGAGGNVWTEYSNPNFGKINLSEPIKDISDFNNPSLNSLFSWPTLKYDVFNPVITNVYSKLNGANFQNDWYVVLRDSWRKAPEAGHLYQLNFNKYYKKVYNNLKTNSLDNTKYYASNSEVFFRDECDWNLNDIEATMPDQIQSHLFATASWSLDFGLDIWVVPYSFIIDLKGTISPNNDIVNVFNEPVWEFYNQHSRNNLSLNASSGFCALKSVYDASEIEKYEFNYNQTIGSGCASTEINSSYDNNPTVQNCGEKYCASIVSTSNNPAQQLVSDIAQGGAGNQYNSNGAGKNDVGWYLKTGNDGKFITQVDFLGGAQSYENYSNGVWNFYDNSKSVYGRFGRSNIRSPLECLECNYMDFKINSQLAGKNCSQPGIKENYIAVTYYDASPQSIWQLVLPCGINGAIAFPNIVGQNINKWKTAIFKLSNWFPIQSSDVDFTISVSQQYPSVTFSLIEFFCGLPENYNFNDIDFYDFVPCTESLAKNSSNQIHQKNQVVIYPNPGNDFFKIQSEVIIGGLRIFNSNGMVVYSKYVGADTKIIHKSDLNNIPGVYFIELTDCEKQIIKKTVVMY